MQQDEGRMPVSPGPKNLLRAGNRLGPYEVIRELGRGGMGVVYEARQSDPNRLVALKVLPPEDASDKAAGFFERETEALARLNHPAIATIYEAGRSESGLRFFAMELVEGFQLKRLIEVEPVTQGSNPRDIERLLKVFLQISDGVHHAHQHGVIHRDLKPSNIMLEASGAGLSALSMIDLPRVKILDFGVAKITDSERPRHTETGDFVGTLSYMSPEQAGSGSAPVDLRADIYSLGVLLYELLTGRLPYEHRQTPLAVLGSIATGSVDRAAKVWRGMKRRMDADLDVIIHTALAHDPENRYQSAWALSHDIRRYLDGQPILARPPSTAYQIRKLVGRHRALTAVSGALAASLVVGIVLTTLSRNRALRAEGAARAETARAEAVNGFLRSMLAAPDPNVDGRDVRVVELLDRAAAQADRSPTADGSMQGMIHTTLAQTYLALGDYEKAERQAGKGIDAYRSVDDPNVAFPLGALARVKIALGDYEAAAPLQAEALRLRRATAGDDDLWTGNLLNDVGARNLYSGNYAAAKDTLLAAASVLEALGDLGKEWYIRAVTNLAFVESELGNLDAAEERLREVLELRRELDGADHPTVAGILNNLAVTLLTLGRVEEVEELHREALDMNRRLFGDEHESVARGHNNLGMFLYRQGRLEEAEVEIGRALELNRSIFGDRHQEVAIGWNNLGLVYDAQGRIDDALEALETSFAIAVTNDPGGFAVATRHINIGNLLLRSGRLDAAVPRIRSAIDIYERTLPEGHYLTATARSILGEAMIRSGQPQQAEPLLVQSFETLLSQFPVSHGRVQAVTRRLVLLYETLGDAAQAAHFRTMLEQD